MVSVFLVFLSASVSAIGSIVLNTTVPVHVGDTVAVNGTGFSVNSSYIWVSINGTVVSLTAGGPSSGTGQNANGTVNASATGAWNATFTVPNLGYGNYTLNASNSTTGDNATTTLTVNQSITFMITNSVSSNNSVVGATVTLNGTGFRANATLNVSFVNSTAGGVVVGTLGNLTSNFTVSSTGTISPTVLVPNLGKGTYTININSTADGVNGGAFNASSFNVTSNITSMPTNISVVGGAITLIGTGFKNYEAVNVSFLNGTGVASLGNLTSGLYALGNGVVATTVTVPNLGKGNYTIQVTSATDPLGSVNQSAFNVTSNITVMTPNISIVGGTISVSGTGFKLGDTLNISFVNSSGGAALGNLTSGFFVAPNGVVSSTVVVPNLGKGTYTLSVTSAADSLGSSNASAFNVTSNITAMPTNISIVGGSISVLGTGFKGYEAINVSFINSTGGAALGNLTSGLFVLGNGVVNAALTVPNLGKGTYTISVTSATDSLGSSNASSFNITSNITYMPSNISVVGGSISLIGTGLKSYEAINVSFINSTGSAITGNITAGLYVLGNGVVSTTVTVPNLGKGVYGVSITSATDTLGFTNASAFNVTSNISFMTPNISVVAGTLTLVATGLKGYEAINVSFINSTGGAALGNLTSGLFVLGNGVASSTVTVPNLGKGVYTIAVTSATDSLGATNASAFNVTPSITYMTPSVALVGNTLTIAGTGFTAYDALNVSFNSTLGNLTAGLFALGNGVVSSTVTIPAIGSGLYNVNIVSAADALGATNASAFTMNATLSSMDVFSGPVGTAVVLRGTGFTANATSVNVLLNSTQMIVTAGNFVNSNGTVAITVRVANTSKGTYYVKINSTGNAAGVVNSSAFTVNSSIISMTPSATVAGTAVTVVGTGFLANDTLNVSLNGTLGNVTSGLTVSSSGIASLTFTMPGLANGTYTLRLNSTTDATGATNASAITANATIAAMNPSSGVVGTLVNLTVTGFVANSSLQVWFGSTQATIASGGVSDANGGANVIAYVPVVGAPATYTILVNSSNYTAGVSNASTFSVTVAAAATSTTSGPAGGGGATTTTTAPSAGTTFASVSPGTPATLSVSNADIPVSAISLSVKASATDVAVSVTKESGLPSTISIAATGSVYAYLTITVSVPASNVESAKVKFTVPKSWVTTNGLDVKTIALNRFADGKWNSLPTTQLSSDANNYYFEATTPGFSTFAVTGTTTPTAPVTPVTPPAAGKDCRDLGCMSGYECKLVGTAYQCSEIAAPATPVTPPTTPPTTPVTPPVTPVVKAAPDYTSTIVVVVVVLVILGAAGYVMMRKPGKPGAGARSEQTPAQKVSEKAKRLSR